MLKRSYKTFLLLVVGIIAIFIIRTGLAVRYQPLRLFELFDTLTVVGSLVIGFKEYRRLRRADWITALALGGLVGAGMYFATLFTPYPLFGVVSDHPGQALARGSYTTLAAIGGLAVMRLGGPVQFPLANGEWRTAGRSLLFGLAIGAPLAILNTLALQVSQGQPIAWQAPLAALLDALQPGIVEEVIYRFALWGLLWLALRKSLPEQAAGLAGLLAMLVHTYAHFDALWVQAPLAALGMGLVLVVLWGLPLTYLALRRGLEAAIAFHWLQDVARFLTGF